MQINEQFPDEQRRFISSIEILDYFGCDYMVDEFITYESDAERFRYIFDKVRRNACKPRNMPNLKSIKESDRCRLFGYILYEKHLYRDALMYFNDALLYATLDSNQLALAYGGRANALYALKHYKESLLDNARALAFNIDPSLKIKLIKQRAFCHTRISKGNLIPIEKEERTKVDLTVDSGKIPCASRKLKISHNAKFGRFICAVDDISPGEILVVEKPYVARLDSREHLHRCNYCFQASNALIPCIQCNYTLYCDNVCREKSWKFNHKYLCPLTCLFSAMKLPTYTYLALDALLRLKCEHESWEDFYNVIMQAKSEQNLRSEEHLQNFDPQSYSAFYSIQSSVDRNDVNGLLERCVVASTFLFILKMTTSLFSNCPNKIMPDGKMLDKERCIYFMGEMLLYHIAIAETSTFGFSWRAKSINYNVPFKGIYPFTNLFNHSCIANTIWCNSKENMVIISSRSIKKGQQIFINYGTSYPDATYESRKELLGFFDVVCRCDACVYQWPVESKLPTFTPATNAFVRKFEKQSRFLFSMSMRKREKMLFKFLKTVRKNIILFEKDNKCPDFYAYRELMKRCWFFLLDVEYFNPVKRYDAYA